MLTVDGLGKQFGDGRLACSARAREQIGMSDAVRLNLVSERCDDMFLSLDILKDVGAKFTV